MKILQQRLGSRKDSSISTVFINGELFGFFDEDQKQLGPKVAGETRIPAGKYKIKLRTDGKLHAKYAEKFPLMHKGMLWLQDVPGFEWIYIHIGNDDDDTEGCLLTGFGAMVNGKFGEFTVQRSTDAYTALYQLVLLAMERGEEIEIDIRDEA